jgi:hypothetical protein
MTKKTGEQTEEEYQQAQKDAWKRYEESFKLIEDIDAFFRDPSAMIELDTGWPVAQLVHNELELKTLVLRFGNWFDGKFDNTDAVEWFKDIVSTKYDVKQQEKIEEYYRKLKNDEGVDEDDDEEIEEEQNMKDVPVKILCSNVTHPAVPLPAYRVVHLVEDPDELLPETLYAIGENGYLWHFVLACPCGCGARIALNALPDASPRWRLHESTSGPTLSPSVWRTTGCRSHFVLRRGNIIWCSGRQSNESVESDYGA